MDVQSPGSFTSSSFKSAEWTSITAKFFERSGLFYDKQQLQKQHAELKKKYSVFLSIKENSGFQWNAELKISADPPEYGTNIWQHIQVLKYIEPLR